MDSPTRDDLIAELQKWAEAPTFDTAGFGNWVEGLQQVTPQGGMARDPTAARIINRAGSLWSRFRNGDIQRSELQAQVRNLAAENKPVTAGSGHSTSPGSTTAPGREGTPITSE